MTDTVYVADLDGTLLDPDARLSPRSRAGLERAIAAGVALSIATARHPQSIRAILGDLPLRLPVVALHGALLHDLATSRHRRVRAIPRDAAARIVEIGRQRNALPWISTHEEGVDRLSYEEATNDGMRWYLDDRRRIADPRLRQVPDLAGVLCGDIVCMTAMAREEVTRDIAATVLAETGDVVTVHVYENAYSPGWYWMTAHARDAGKDTGLRDLIDDAGLHGRRVVAFGDTDGDLALFAAADHGVAVANATPALLAVADEAIGHHTNDSVIEYILRDAGLDV